MPVGRMITAMATPFDHALALNVGDSPVVPATTLSTSEKLELFEAVVDAVGDRADVWANTGNYNTAESIELTRAAEKTGVHGVLLVVPYYNRPSQEGLYRHFKAIAEVTPLPILLYNVPSRTSQNLSWETVLRLHRDCLNIVGVKEASSDLVQAGLIARGREREFALLSGDDKNTLPMLSVGGDGVVSVASHLVGPQIRRMIEAFMTGQVRVAQELHLRLLPLFTGLFVTSNPVPLKWALKALGRDIGVVRPPLCMPGPSDEAFLQNLLREQSLL